MIALPYSTCVWVWKLLEPLGKKILTDVICETPLAHCTNFACEFFCFLVGSGWGGGLFCDNDLFSEN